MNIQLKQRLVGAIVLVALAVIFIPMLLPGSGSITGGISGSNIPPEPDYRFAPTLPAPKAPSLADAPELPLDDAALAKASNLEKTATGDASNSIEGKAPERRLPPNAESAPSKKTSRKPQSAKSTIGSEKQTETGKKQKNEKSLKASGWVVQVGSFSSARNAKALRDKLRKQGNASFIENSKNSTGPVYRVRVGPMVSHTAAEKLRVKLAKVSGLKGLVQAYP